MVTASSDLGQGRNEVAHKYCFSGVMSECTLQLGVSELIQQSAKRVGVAVHVANYIIVLL
jgi:hypothetical protein